MVVGSSRSIIVGESAPSAGWVLSHWSPRIERAETTRARPAPNIDFSSLNCPASSPQLHPKLHLKPLQAASSPDPCSLLQNADQTAQWERRVSRRISLLTTSLSSIHHIQHLQSMIWADQPRATSSLRTLYQNNHTYVQQILRRTFASLPGGSAFLEVTNFYILLSVSATLYAYALVIPASPTSTMARC